MGSKQLLAFSWSMPVNVSFASTRGEFYHININLHNLVSNGYLGSSSPP